MTDPNKKAAANASIDAPAGFKFGAVAGGIKPSGKSDVSLIVGDRPVVAAGVYTTNQVVAAPVTWCRRITPTPNIRAVATVSGNANACTGQQGESDNEKIAGIVAEKIGCEAAEVLVMSTGIIGRFLPMQKVEAALIAAADQIAIDQPAAADHCATNADAMVSVAEAIRTTDNGRKIAGEVVSLSGGDVTIAVMCKGAGMIAPNMATLLAVALSDAALSPAQAQAVLTRVSQKSLNRITVDGHASTNDTFLLLCSGNRGDQNPVGLSASDLEIFEQAFTNLAIKLGKQIVADGEGATHYMALSVDGAANDQAAERIARHTAQSLLVKTAITGNDPNWGRIVSAAGAAGVPIDVAATSLAICGVEIYRDGNPVPFDDAALSKMMAATIEVPVTLTVGSGEGSATLWASDLTKDYVAFNSEYTT